jgi:drug/metabolite transporter (DMT)-like permease
MHRGASPTSSSPPASAFLAVIGANVALAFGPWFVRLADTDGGVGPVAAAFWRVTLAAPLIAAMALGAGAKPSRLSPALWATLVFAGVCFAADLGSWHLGILRTTLANATLFGNAATFIFPLYGFLVARAWPSRQQGVALALAGFGAALLMGRSYQLDPRNLAGDLLCLTAGILYAAYFIAMARARAIMAPLSSLAVSTVACIVPLWLFAHALGEQIMPRDWSAVIGLALVSQVIGQGLMIYALGKLSPLVVGLALLVQPVVAGTIGWFAYGERLALPDFVGAGLVAVALVLVRGERRVARGTADPQNEVA